MFEINRKLLARGLVINWLRGVLTSLSARALIPFDHCLLATTVQRALDQSCSKGGPYTTRFAMKR